MQNYTFPALAPEALIEHWCSQGLAAPDISRAIRHLKTVGYHRLNRYDRFFNALPGTFKAGGSYNGIWAPMDRNHMAAPLERPHPEGTHAGRPTDDELHSHYSRESRQIP